MSLILEALKKSERQRLLGTAPTLASPVMAVRRRRSVLLPLLALVVVLGAGGGIGWWLYQRSEHVSAQLAQQTAPVSTSATGNPAAPISIGRALTPKPQISAAKAVTPPAPVAVPPAANNAPPAVVGTTSAIAAKSEPPNANPATEKAKVAPPPPVATKPAPPPAAEPVSSIAAKPPSTKLVPTAKVPPVQAEVGQVQPPASAPAATAQETPPLVWTLPYSLRKDLPPLTLSMQVYADDPAERFAIINDERQVEGDTIGTSELKLVEIRQDGLIMEMNGQRFLYPRGGR